MKRVRRGEPRRTGVTQPDLLAPIEYCVTIFLALIFTGLGVAGVVAASGTSVSVGGVGESEPCLAVDGSQLNRLGLEAGVRIEPIAPPPSGATLLRGVGPRESWPAVYSLCRQDASFRQQVRISAPRVLDFVAVVGVLIAALMMLRRLRLRGVFLPEVAAALWRLSGVTFLAAFLLAGLHSLAFNWALGALTDRTLGFPAGAEFRPSLLVAAAVLATFARILAVAAHYKEEVDATV